MSRSTNAQFFGEIFRENHNLKIGMVNKTFDEISTITENFRRKNSEIGTGYIEQAGNFVSDYERELIWLKRSQTDLNNCIIDY